MGVDTDAGSGMQFDKVEGPGPAEPPACAQCRRPLDEYFALGGHMFCRTCIDGYKTGGSFSLALLYGAGAAAVGALIWYAVAEASGGSSFGLIGIVVGLAVGFAVRKGARGRGGWKFQALAMTLTYLAITTSYIPLILKEVSKRAHQTDASADKAAAPTGEAEPVSGQAAPGQAVPGQAAPGRAEPSPSGGSVVLAFLFLFGFALAVPFMGGVGFMGWIIIGIALYEAWKLNRRVPITGPFRFGGALSVPSPALATPGTPPPAAGP